MEEDKIHRINRLIEYFGDTQKGFADRIGVDKANLSKIMSGQRTIGQGIINKIILATGVLRPWLIDGKGDPFITQDDYKQRFGTTPNPAPSGNDETDTTFSIETTVKKESIEIPLSAWRVIEMQAKSLEKRDNQIDELIQMLKDQKGGAAGAKGAAPKAALG